jgi:Protein of unknown function (DUF3240)
MSELTRLCRITIVIPTAIEDDIVESLLQIQPPIEGFTTIDAEGHGQSFDNARTHECVRGRVERKMLLMVLPRVRADAVIELLRRSIKCAEAAWWIESVEQFGRLS